MKQISLLLLVFALDVNARTLECPKELKGGVLSGYGVFHDEQTELQGEFRKVNGGYEVELPTRFKYFVCEYGSIKKREGVKLGTGISSCVLKVRESKGKPKDIKLDCK